jgi:CRP-like cAMP-binding protein
MVEPQTMYKYPLFGGLMEEQLKSILPVMQEEKFAPNENIITEGQPNDKIYFLIEGKVAVIKANIELAVFYEGEAFGEVEVLDVIPSIASIRSLTQVTTMSISNRGLREIYKLDIKIFSLIIMNLARDLARRLRRMDEKLASSPVLL